jgi:FixJ family two-component response regulator
MDQGALGFLKKPYDIEKLRSEIAAALDFRD